MKVIYLAGPYRAKTEWEILKNIQRSQDMGARIAQAGFMFISPHLNSAFMGGVVPDEFWLDGTLEILKRCDAIYMLPGWQLSAGSLGEKAWAESVGMPVFTSWEEFEAWARTQRPVDKWSKK